jgi:hypothetical protein
MNEEERQAILRQLELIKKLNARRYVTIIEKDGSGRKRVASWEAVDDEIDALIGYCQKKTA